MRFAISLLLAAGLAFGTVDAAVAKSTKSAKTAKSSKNPKSGPLNGGMYSSGPSSSSKGGSYKTPSTGNQYGQR